MRLAEINKFIKPIEYERENFINLQALYHLLKTNLRIEMEECLIIPSYIQDDKRMELYQYEFCGTDEFDFEEYILKLTGKEKIEHVPEDILRLRRNCFSKCDEPNGLVDYLEFIIDNKDLQEEIKRAFGDYFLENLYVVVY